MPTIDERYPDLIDAHSAPEHRRILAAMDTLAVSYAPPADTHAAIVQALRERMSVRSPAPTAPGRQRIPRSRRTILVLAAVLAVTIIAGSAAALNNRPLADQALSWDPDWQSGTARIVSQHLRQQLNLSRSVCGYSMTVKRVYADRFNVVVASTISGPPARNFGEPGTGFYAETTLRDQAGRVLPGGVGLTTPPVGHGVGAWATYEIPRLADTQSTLRLRLTASSILGTEIFSGAHPVSRSCETYSTMHPALPGLTKSEAARSVTIHGPLTFALTVPIDRRLRSRVLHRSSTVNGTTLTLTKALVTPIEARLMVQGVNHRDVEGSLSLDSPGQRKTTSWLVHFRSDPHILLVDAPLYQYHGGLTLTLKSLHWVSGKQVLPGGPWRFHFTLP